MRHYRLEKRVSKLKTDSNKEYKYNRRNNLEIHWIPSNISDDILKKKAIQTFEGIGLSVTVNDIEDCLRFGKSGNSNIAG